MCAGYWLSEQQLVHIYACVYVYVYIYSCTYMYVYICMYRWSGLRCALGIGSWSDSWYTYIYVYLYKYMNIYKYVCTYICICLYIYLYWYTFRYVCYISWSNSHYEQIDGTKHPLREGPSTSRSLAVDWIRVICFLIIWTRWSTHGLNNSTPQPNSRTLEAHPAEEISYDQSGA